MTRTYKRRKFFIKKEFQGRYILACFLLMAGGGLLFNVLMGTFSADSLTISYSNHDIQMGQTPLMLMKEALTANWILLVVGGGLLVLATMLISHRIAGPLYRFESVLDSMNEGRLDEVIRLRDKDDGKELANKINDVNDQFSDSFRTIKLSSDALLNLIQQVEDFDSTKHEKEDLAGLFWSMREQNRKISETCEYYTLRDE